MDDNLDSLQVTTTLDAGCVVGIGCKVHTHHHVIKLEPQLVYKSVSKFTIFGKHYCTNQWGQTYEITADKPMPMPIVMEQIYASDTIKPTNSAFLVKPVQQQSMIIKPRSAYNDYKPTMDAPIMGTLLVFTIYLTATWAWSSLSHWNNLLSDIKGCLRSTS